MSAAGFDGMLDDKAKVAMQQLADKLELAKRDAFAEGMDFAIGPIAPESEDMFEVRDIFAPQKLTISCKAGAVDRSFEPPPGWIVHRNPGYIVKDDLEEEPRPGDREKLQRWYDPSACDLGRGQEP